MSTPGITAFGAWFIRDGVSQEISDSTQQVPTASATDSPIRSGSSLFPDPVGSPLFESTPDENPPWRQWEQGLIGGLTKSQHQWLQEGLRSLPIAQTAQGGKTHGTNTTRAASQKHTSALDNLIALEPPVDGNDGNDAK